MWGGCCIERVERVQSECLPHKAPEIALVYGARARRGAKQASRLAPRVKRNASSTHARKHWQARMHALTRARTYSHARIDTHTHAYLLVALCTRSKIDARARFSCLSARPPACQEGEWEDG